MLKKNQFCDNYYKCIKYLYAHDFSSCRSKPNFVFKTVLLDFNQRQQKYFLNHNILGAGIYPLIILKIWDGNVSENNEGLVDLVTNNCSNQGL